MSLRRMLWLWAPAVVVMAGIGYASLRPMSGGPAFPQSDKLLHALAYALVALVVARALGGNVRLGAGKVALAACVWSAAYGGLLEIVQGYVGRSADWLDALANAAGAVAAVGAWRAASWWRASRRSDTD